MLRSFSVIVPVLNKENEIIRTLESIDASMAYFYEQYGDDHNIQSELIVVDEGSTDRTPALLAEFGQHKPNFKVLHHFRSLGIGPARNTGVKFAQGDILFFCDGDDLFFKEHILLCFTLLNHQPNVAENSPKTLQFSVGDTVYPLTLPSTTVGVVRTGVRMQDPLHPYWKAAIENTLALNLCIRRDCHEFIEGFPEAPVYKQIGGCEDVSYDLWMAKFFKVLKVEIETVEYIRYPGNNFDRQLKKFQTAPEQYQDATPLAEKALHALRHQLEQDRFNYLVEKFKKFELTPAFFAVLNWQQLANDYLSQNCYAEAIALYEQGLAVEPDARETVKNVLAAIYNNFGSTFHKQGQPEQARTYFQKAIDLNPTLSATDLARVHFNVATACNEQGQFEQAIPHLQQALTLQPDFSEAIAELAQTTYRAQLLTKGYQFARGFTEPNFALFAKHLEPFAQRPNLKALEIGSREGRLTCWLLDNILTQATASLTCLDRFEGLLSGQPIADRFAANIARSGAAEKVQTVAGQPRDYLRSQPYHSYQLIMISGVSAASELLELAVLSWSVLAVGGVVVFAGGDGDVATQPSPKTAIDAFTTLFGSKLKRLHQGSEVLLEKLAD